MPALAPLLSRQPTPFTARDFDRMVRSGAFGDTRAELRNGEIVKLSPKHVPHGLAQADLCFAFQNAIRSQSGKLRAMMEVTVDLGEYFQPLPDIVIYEASDMPAGHDGALPGKAVRLIVEVSQSSLTDDLGSKLVSYAQAGVAEYWVVDMKKRRLLLHAEPDGDTYARRVPFAFGDTITALTLPLTLDTSSLLEA